MKKFSQFLFISALFFSAATAQAQQPFYGVNLEPICWSKAGQLDSCIYVAWLDAASTTRPTRLHYFDVSGTAVTVSGGQLRPGYCNAYTLDSLEANIVASLNSFSAGPDTIAANSAYKIIIANLGITTHDIFVDGTAMRLYPGEYYHWSDFYDTLRSRWVYNPQVIISQGTAGQNNTRKVVTPKS